MITLEFGGHASHCKGFRSKILLVATEKGHKGRIILPLCPFSVATASRGHFPSGVFALVEPSFQQKQAVEVLYGIPDRQCGRDFMVAFETFMNFSAAGERL